MKNVFLRDWAEGDVVSAADMQELAAAIMQLEGECAAGGGMAPCRGGVYVEAPALDYMPWEVYMGADGKFYYEGGPLLVGWNAERGAIVQWFDGGAVEELTTARHGHFYLEVLGEVKLVRQDGAGVELERGAEDWYAEGVRPEGLRVRVVYSTGHNAPGDCVWQRVIAHCNKEWEEPLTQWRWGVMSLGEVLGFEVNLGEDLGEEGRAAFGEEGHESGMGAVCAVDASSEAEGAVEGTLWGGMTAAGGVEFYLGPVKVAPADDDDDNEGSTGDDDDDEMEGEEDELESEADMWQPGGGSVIERVEKPEDGGVIRVRYGYVAGEGFASCDLIQVDGEYYWELVLDEHYLSELCNGLDVAATLEMTAEGSSPGIHGAVAMGWRKGMPPEAWALGAQMQGTGTFEFAGLDNDDVSLHDVRFELKWKNDEAWVQARRWYLSADVLHEAGAFVARDYGTGYADPWIKASKWYRFRVKPAAFKAGARKYLRRQLGAVKVDDEVSSPSEDSEVLGVLSGTLLKPSASFILR